MYLCYVLVDQNKKRVYTGQTKNWKRRLRQHNGEIKGGARYTRGGKWAPLYHICGFETLQEAMRCERLLKKSRVRVGGIRGRLLQLKRLLDVGIIQPEQVKMFLSKHEYRELIGDEPFQIKFIQ